MIEMEDSLKRIQEARKEEVFLAFDNSVKSALETRGERVQQIRADHMIKFKFFSDEHPRAFSVSQFYLVVA